MAVTGLNRPDFRTVSDFRKRHLQAFGGLLVQVLQVCRRAGLGSLGHVALHGTKIKTNANEHKAMSYGRMSESERRLRQEVRSWFAQAAADAAEDREHVDRPGDELPEWVADRQRRLRRHAQRQSQRTASAHQASTS